MKNSGYRVSSLLVGTWLGGSLLVASPLFAQKAPAANEPAAVTPKEVVVEEDKSREEDDSHHGLFGALRVGPTASVGFPFLMNYGVDATWDRTFGVGISGGRLSREFTKETELEIFNWDVRARWFPWQGSFFLGAAFGTQGIVGKTSTTIKRKANDIEMSIPTTLRLEVESKYLTPHLGWFATWDSGFTMGFELGYQMPMSSKSDLQTAFQSVSASAEQSVKDSEDYKKNEADLEEAANSVGQKPVPYINLLRLGWLL